MSTSITWHEMMLLLLFAGEEDETYEQYQHQQPSEEDVQRPSGARKYSVHRDDQGEPGEASGARQYR